MGAQDHRARTRPRTDRVLTPDGVFFMADSVISERILNKYGIPFTADYGSATETFDMLDAFSADYFVPSHGDICKDITLSQPPTETV